MCWRQREIWGGIILVDSGSDGQLTSKGTWVRRAAGVGGAGRGGREGRVGCHGTSSTWVPELETRV